MHKYYLLTLYIGCMIMFSELIVFYWITSWCALFICLFNKYLYCR